MIKAIKKWLNFGWEELDLKEVPNWVKKRKTKFLKGNHFLYRLENGKYYHKDRELEYPEGIPRNRSGIEKMAIWKSSNLYSKRI